MRLTRCLLLQTLKGFDKYAKFHPSPLSLEEMFLFGTKTGTEQSSFEFLRRELPVRLANIMMEMNQLPEPLLNVPSVTMVSNWYKKSFTEIIGFENSDGKDLDTLSTFADTLVVIRNRHANVVETMAQGVMELKDRYGEENMDTLQYFLNRFFTSRISIRMLINQHALLYGSQLGNHPRHIGCIDPKCNVLEVVKDAYANARFLCEQYYLTAPELELITHNIHDNEEDISIVYVPSHLYHMLFELFKNSLRAVVENFPVDSTLPKLKVHICKGKEDLSIKLCDQGGGIPYNNINKLFEYMYSTAPSPSCADSGSAPLAGYGYGLPLSRLYAQYFQGDLVVSSVDGFGTDAYIYLKVLSNEANECLPIYNTTSAKMYETDVVVSDWTSPPKSPQNSRTFSTHSRTYQPRT
ncbi:pyruvate dehydrogenase (acetyl-transferring) kinase isozyme 2, mitochondrial-like isoform X2 [Mytilus trossulus]|uniref:pyruvate dehydrogenase (acetyl-transferring) kinase isozyme 2, mitochondrial-like isoform X2 n=1 Tax=Mytilus trossulus TaxID=6551 RepID=UPI0030056FDD